MTDGAASVIDIKHQILCTRWVLNRIERSNKGRGASREPHFLCSSDRIPLTSSSTPLSLDLFIILASDFSPNNMTTTVEILDLSAPHTFIQPVKRINEPHDVPSFLASHAYTQIVAFLFQLNAAMFPTITNDKHIQTWTEAPTDSAPVNQLRELLAKLDDMIDEAPPDPGPRRFGNISFRKWYELAEARLPELLAKHLPTNVLSSGGDAAQEEGRTTARDELSTYLLGSFGSPQRLDYGTGHELSFLAFLCGIWKVGGFRNVDDGVEERAIVLGLLEPYLGLVRRLIKTYTLEPAGSRGVWGVDDNAFLPYIFGSAQLCPPLSSVHDPLPSDGSLHDAVDPADIIKPGVIERERHSNMYFGAVGFIYDVKRGPFWEHSPILYDISGIKTGWAKINKVIRLMLVLASSEGAL